MSRIRKAVGRSVEEWIGKTPDSKAPPHVLVRIFERHDGRCHISGRKIAPGERWQADHIVRLEDGGENRESNLAPALVEPHKVKSSEERRAAVPINRRKESHLGVKTPSANPIRSRGFEPAEKRRKRLTRLANGVCELARRTGIKGGEN